MNGLRQSVTRSPAAAQLRSASVQRSPYGRTAAYRRLSSQAAGGYGRQSTEASQPPHLTTLRSQFLPSEIRTNFAGVRSLHTTTPRRQEAKDAVKEKPSEKKPAEEEAKSTAEEESKSGEEKTDDKDGKKKEKKEDLPPPPPHGDKSPWQVFTETLQTELKSSKEWNESTKQLADRTHQFTESESVKKAREAYERSTGAVASTTAKVVKTTAGAVAKGAGAVWETPVVKGVRATANATGRVIEKSTRPIRETEAFQSVKNVIDDGSSSRYGGWVEKEERRKARERREAEEALKHGRVPGTKQEVPVENPDAGTNITVHKDAAWKESWREFRDSSRVMQGLFSAKAAFNESENPFISTARSISDRIAGFFAENETAMVIKKFREMDPAFQVEPFLRDMREYILPEVLDAYVKGDTETLKQWLSAAQYSVYEALTKQYQTAGLKSDGRILDIRHVEILNARLLEPGDVPVFIVTCRTQEVHVYRNSKSGELAAGMEDKVQLVTYAIGVTRVPEDVNNPETRGWRLIELQKSARDYI